MESLCSPASASSMATPGNLSHVFKPLCPPSQICSRSAIMMGQPLRRIERIHLQSSIIRDRKPVYASVADTAQKVIEVEDEPEVKNQRDSLSPTSFEVQSLLMEICDETSIAELQLKVDSFKLRVKRDVTKLKGSTPPVVAVAPPIPSKPMEESGIISTTTPVTTPKTSAPSVALALSNPNSKGESKIGLLEGAASEGLHFVTSPKVGFFRRSRVVKKKSGRPLCEEGQIVKEGQVVCYVDQLGTQQPIEAPNSGEVMKILCKDGEPVGYGEPLIAIRPSFAGIK